MAQTENLKYIDGRWGYYTGCSCNKTNFHSVEIPPKTKPVLIKKFASLVGPVTGYVYNITPHQISLDIDERDADVWIKEGIALDAQAALSGGKRGRLTRNGT